MNDPQIIIADEPTTALDSTLQAQVLDLFKSINEKTGVSIVIISHDLGVIRKYCHRIAVMYAGQILESAPADEIFENARHPYTKALIRVSPSLNIKKDERLMEVPGFVPEKSRGNARSAFLKRDAQKQMKDVTEMLKRAQKACTIANAANTAAVRCDYE